MIGNIQLRPEAKPLDWLSLNLSQQNALRRLATQLIDAIEDLQNYRNRDDDPGTNRPLAWIRHDALARLSMIDGARGSGKTTVLISLLELCGRSRDNATVMPDDLRELLKQLDNRTVWLDPIDLDMFPSSANLLAAILARIELRMVRKLRKNSNQDDADAQRKLSQLFRKVAVAWGETEEERVKLSGNLDADASVVKRIERERLELRQQFSDLLNTLVERIFHDTEHDQPIFVLIVDDFDLNPSRSRSVLDLLRQIAVPRLYTVVLGNFELVRTMAHLHFIKDFSKAGGDRLQEGWMSLKSASVGRLADRTAEAWLRKSLPPLQRIQISDLSPEEILQFRPSGAGNEEWPRLYKLMDRMQVVVRPPSADEASDSSSSPTTGWAFGKEVRTFLELCMFPGIAPTTIQVNWPPRQHLEEAPPPQIGERALTPSSLTEKLKSLNASSVYWAPRMVRGLPRNVADIWLRSYDLLRGKSQVPFGGLANATDLLTLARDLFMEELGQDPAFQSDDCEAFRNVLDNCLARGADLDSAPLSFSWVVGPSRIVRTSDSIVSISHKRGSAAQSTTDAGTAKRPEEPTSLCQRNIRVCKTTGWTLTHIDPSQEINKSRKRKRSKECACSTAAHFMIVHDLITLSNRRYRGIFPARPFHHSWASTEWTAGPYDSAYLRWPHPLLNSFWEYDIFLDAWNRAISELTIDDTRADHCAEQLMHAWIDLSATVMAWDLQNSSEQQILGPLQRSDWMRTLRRLDSLAIDAAKPSLFGVRMTNWLCRLALLFMPELLGGGLTKQSKSGGKVSARRSMINSLDIGKHLSKFWQDNLDFIRRQRANNLAALAHHHMYELIDQILKLRRASAGTNTIFTIVAKTTPTMREVEEAQALHSHNWPAKRPSEDLG